MTISESLDKQIRDQEAEIDRLDSDYDANTKAAHAKLTLLMKARAAVTKELDALVTELQAAGVWPKG